MPTRILAMRLTLTHFEGPELDDEAFDSGLVTDLGPVLPNGTEQLSGYEITDISNISIIARL